MAVVLHTGDIELNLYGKLKINIDIMLSHYPYDTQSIYITITSWSYPTTNLHLFPNSKDPNDSLTIAKYHFDDNIAWKIIKTSVSNNTLEWSENESYSEITFKI